MTEAPPALTPAPQFTEEYWRKAPRQTAVAHIDRVTNLEEGWVAIVMKEGMTVRRKREEITQLLAPNAEVHIETFNKELVTGLFVPGVGWAFRMTAQDLAEYTKELSVQIHQQRMEAKNQMAAFLASVITEYFIGDGGEIHTVDDGDDTLDVVMAAAPFDPVHLARIIIVNMERAGK